MKIQTYTPKLGQEFALADIRAEAMKESLMEAGRFDGKNVRDRLLEKYDRENTKVIKIDNCDAGFYSITGSDGKYYLTHLYILPNYQRKGLGKAILDHVKNEYSGFTINLNALKGSPANIFYKSNGFCEIGVSEYDVIYEYNGSKLNEEKVI